MRAMPCRISGHRADALPSRPPCTTKKKGKPKLPLQIWSGKRVSNSRPQPWQGCALPTELFPHLPTAPDVSIRADQQASNYIAIFWLYSIANQKINQSPSILQQSSRLRRSQKIFRHQDTDRIWRRGPESNRTNRICNPGHNRFATAPEIHISLTKKGSICFPFCGNWSGKRVSNSRPQPWQGCALPTELFPHFTEASHCTTFAAME